MVMDGMGSPHLRRGSRPCRFECYRLRKNQERFMILRNLRPVMRMLVTNPWFSGLIVITIALGVGVNTAMFSVVNSVLLRPLPVEDPGQIVVLVEQKKDASDFLSTSYSDFLDL